MGRGLGMGCENKKAVVISAHSAYFPGLVAMLNGLNLYGSSLDVHWIYQDKEETAKRERVEDLLQKVEEADLCFRVKTVSISSLMERWPTIRRDSNWLFCFYKYKYLQSLAEEYNVVGQLDADMLVLANPDPWFNLVAGSDMLASVDHNFCGFMQIDSYDENYTTYRWRESPLGNFPLICDPKKWGDVFETVWELAISFSEDAVEMVHLHRALYECNKIEKVITLPDGQWNRHWLYYEELHKTNNTPPQFFTGTSQLRIYTIHGRWWQEGFCEGELKRTVGNEIFYTNVAGIHKLHNKMRELGPVHYNYPPS